MLEMFTVKGAFDVLHWNALVGIYMVDELLVDALGSVCCHFYTMNV